MKVTNDGGFTIAETLVALTILAIASVIFASSISSASTQLAAADKLLDAVSLSKRLMAETQTQFTDSLDGIDQSSGLFWRRRVDLVHPGSQATSGALVLVSIEVFRTKTDPAIFQLRSVKSGAN
jgi:prepilin-type N-terminal cleavage/methylation domain-containing protein